MRLYPLLDRAIREQINAARKAAGLTQRGLSRRNNYIQNIESGRQSVSASELHMIAVACNATGAKLLAKAVRAKGR
jgi:transcriptional regulator with XRE-family HTH domain